LSDLFALAFVDARSSMSKDEPHVREPWFSRELLGEYEPIGKTVVR